MMNARAKTAALPLLIALLTIGGCGPDGVTAPPARPEITIVGVEDEALYDAPVTIDIRVDRGSYIATLDGAPFISGTTVQERGRHLLHVSAREGTATTETQLSFTIAAPPGGTTIVRIIDLGPNEAGGGGDAILVSDSSGAGTVHAVIDAGAAGTNASDPGRVARRLQELGVDTLEFMLLTHAHSDHFQGMTDILNSVAVRRFYYNGQVRALSFYQDLLNLARARADTVIVPTDTAVLSFGRSAVQSRFTILPALPTYLSNANAPSDELNEGSMGALLERGTFEMFLTGDGEVEANHRWRTGFAALTEKVDVLKVGHHGANNAIFDNGFSGSSAWLSHTAPSISVISANGRTHPRQNALARLLQQSGMRTFCTNVHGEITIRVFSDSSYDVDVERNRDADCEAGSEATT